MYTHTYIYICIHVCVRPTQSMIYVDCLIATFQDKLDEEIVLLIAQYKYLKISRGESDAPGSDPAHKIMWYQFYYSKSSSC